VVVTLLPKSLGKAKRSKLENITIRGFGGGWNTIQDDLSMALGYVLRAKNFVRTPSGSMQIRYGSKWFVDLSDTVTGTRVVDMEFFNNRLICVTDTGEIASVNNDGVKTKIWSADIAADLPASPDGWSTNLTSIDFVPFRNTMIVHNGIDKPVIISATFVVTYLQDLATGSNVNVPIGRYGCTVSNYHCVGGIPAAATTIYVSSVGTSGVFPGDIAPNDSISIDVGAYAPEGSDEIRGIAGFRNFLLVFFNGQCLPIQLGIYEGDVHAPTFPDSLPKFGLLGHRCIKQLEKDIIFAGFEGIGSARKNVFQNLDSEFLSDLIEPEYRKTISNTSEEDTLLSTFMLYDPTAHRAELHTPGNRQFMYNFSDSKAIQYQACTEGTGPVWDCGCTTLAGRVYTALGMRLYQRGNSIFDDEAHAADLIHDRDSSWVNDHAYVVDDLIHDDVTMESYTCRVSHTSSVAPATFEADRAEFPGFWEKYEGEGIDILLELPWIDGKNPMIVKQLRFVQVGTKGTAEFTLEVYVDNLHRDADGDIVHDPALSAALVGNDVHGWGADAEEYGAGRSSADPRLLGFPAKFKTLKPIFRGLTRRPLTIVSLSFLYSKGQYFR